MSQPYQRALVANIFSVAAMESTATQIAEINLQPSRTHDYSAYVPVRLGKLDVAAFIDSGNTFANVISPQTMTTLGSETSQLKPIPQLSVGTAAAGKKMKILGQAPRIELQIGQHPAKFWIHPLVLQGLVHPLNLCGPFLQRAGIDQINSRGVLRTHGKEVSMCSPRQTGGSLPLQSSAEVCTLHITALFVGKRQYTPHGPLAEARSGPRTIKVAGRSHRVLPVQLHPPLPAGALMVLQPMTRSLLGDNPVLHEVQPDGSLAVLADNLELEDHHHEPDTIVGSVQEVTAAPTTVHADTSPPPEVTTHGEFDALPQAAKIKWLVAQFRLDSSPLLQRDSHLRKEVIWTLLQYADVILIVGYGKTNIISHTRTVHPGTTPIKMKHRPLNPIMEESLRQQMDRWLEQRVIEERRH